MTALATGGPGTLASADALARYVRDYDPDDEDLGASQDDTGDDDGPGPPGGRPGDGELGARDDSASDEEDFGPALFDALDDFGFGMGDGEDFDESTMAGLFGPVTTLWQALGATGKDGRLTPLGWWGLPEAMRRVWHRSPG